MLYVICFLAGFATGLIVLLLYVIYSDCPEEDLFESERNIYRAALSKLSDEDILELYKYIHIMKPGINKFLGFPPSGRADDVE